MRLALACCFVASLAAAPAVADPALKTSMPAISANVANGGVVVRLDQGVLGSGHSLKPRTIVLVGYDAKGMVVGESTADVPRRLTYARMPLTPALASATTVTVSVRQD